MSERRPYRRPMDPRWWWAPGPYRAYTLRELSGVAVAIYGAVLFCGLLSLSRGPESWTAFLQFLRSPFSILLHLALLGAVIYHVKTWFETLPKTQPKIIVDGKPLPAATITGYATMAAAACSALLVLVILWGTR
jgi:fumarate reductase subunit C